MKKSCKNGKIKIMFKTWWRDYKKLLDTDRRWIAIWLLTYFTFLILDIFMPNYQGSALLKYVGIFSCTVYAYQRSRKDSALILALFLTFLADTILVWTDWEVFGVIIFSFAQFMHISRQADRPPKALLGFSVVLILCYAFARILGFTPIYAIGMIYAAEIIINTGLSVQRYKKHKREVRARCGFYGFMCFIACDTCVGLRHLALDGILPVIIVPLVSFLVWFFYFPSQVLLANSTTLPPKLQNKTR